jgi:hypothetical protein
MWSNGLGARQSPAGNDLRTEAEDIVRICYPATTGIKTADWEDFVRAVVGSQIHELARAL